MILCKILLDHFRLVEGPSRFIIAPPVEAILMMASMLILRIVSGLTRNSRISWRRLFHLTLPHQHQRVRQRQLRPRYLVQDWVRIVSSAPISLSGVPHRMGRSGAVMPTDKVCAPSPEIPDASLIRVAPVIARC